MVLCDLPLYLPCPHLLHLPHLLPLQPPHCSSHTPGTALALAQGLCTCCFLYLECLSCKCLSGSLPHLLGCLLKYGLMCPSTGPDSGSELEVGDLPKKCGSRFLYTQLRHQALCAPEPPPSSHPAVSANPSLRGSCGSFLQPCSEGLCGPGTQ